MTKKQKKTKKRKVAKPAKDKTAQPAPAPAPKIVPHPTAGPKVAEFETKLDEQIAAGESEQRRGPGRPRKQPPAEPATPPSAPLEIVAGAVKMPFELWAISQGVPGLALSDKESRQLAEPVKALLDYYLPQIPAIAYAWSAFGVSIFWVIRTRLLLIAEIKKQKTFSPPKTDLGGKSQGSRSPRTEARTPPRSANFPSAEEIKPTAVI